jgi:adenylate kinase
LLVGVAGSGKQTLSRFAAYVAEVAWHGIELRKGYGLAEFREDLKAAMRVRDNSMFAMPPRSQACSCCKHLHACALTLALLGVHTQAQITCVGSMLENENTQLLVAHL